MKKGQLTIAMGLGLIAIMAIGILFVVLLLNSPLNMAKTGIPVLAIKSVSSESIIVDANSRHLIKLFLHVKGISDVAVDFNTISIIVEKNDSEKKTFELTGENAFSFQNFVEKNNDKKAIVAGEIVLFTLDVEDLDLRQKDSVALTFFDKKLNRRIDKVTFILPIIDNKYVTLIEGR